MITASIVLYKSTLEKIQATIDSFLGTLGKNATTLPKKLYLIDNSPEPLANTDLQKLSSNIEYTFNDGKNLGYGGAHNIALKKSIAEKADFHIILNPDIRFEPSVVDELVSYAAQNSDVVYMLPKVIYPDGSLQYLCKLLPTPFDLIFRRFFPKTAFTEKLNDRYVLKNSGYDKIMNPPCLSGCFMFLRTNAIETNNLFFDERYFMYCEDFDLIRRLHRIGKTVYYPKVQIIHDHARASYKNKKMLACHVKSAIKYFNKFGWFFDKERNLVNKQILNEINRSISHGN